MLSASDRQSVELMEKVGTHTRGAGVVIDHEFFESTEIVQHNREVSQWRAHHCAARQSRHGPAATQGMCCSMSSLFTATQTPSGKPWWAATLRGGKLRVLSSFKGKANKFYALAKELGLAEGIAPSPNPINNGTWSAHWIDIHLAVAQGLKVDVEELRRTTADEDIWQEEFCCIPTDGALEFVPLELIQTCESPAASTEWDGEARPGLYLGL